MRNHDEIIGDLMRRDAPPKLAPPSAMQRYGMRAYVAYLVAIGRLVVVFVGLAMISIGERGPWEGPQAFPNWWPWYATYELAGIGLLTICGWSMIWNGDRRAAAAGTSIRRVVLGVTGWIYILAWAGALTIYATHYSPIWGYAGLGDLVLFGAALRHFWLGRKMKKAAAIDEDAALRAAVEKKVAAKLAAERGEGGYY